MKNRVLGSSAMSFLLAGFFLALAPAWSQTVDDRIKTLEQELSELKVQQMELKKEAAAAAAALPNFSYRPGAGLNIEAADKSWGIRLSLESHFRMIFGQGQDQVGRTMGEIMLRRFRPQFFFCINNCLWELEWALDNDGFGTGNAKNSTNTGGSSIMQRGALHIRLEKLNPWLPTVDLGGDVSTAHSSIRQGSSAIGSQMEYDLISRGIGPNTGRSGWATVLNWDDRSLSGIGIPGRITRFQMAMGSVSEGDDNLSSFTDRKDFNTFIGLQPFSQLKEKWLRGLQLEFGAWFCNVDDRAVVDNGCTRYRIQDDGDAARQTLFDTGANTVGRGLQTRLAAGVQWEVGPYRLRLFGTEARGEDGNNSVPAAGFTGNKKAMGWLIGHDLFIWSPKGFLTGSATTPGSILFGTHFHRANVSCDGCPATINGGQFHQIRVLRREWDLFYFLAPRMSIGVHWQWWDADNLTTTVQKNLDIRKNGTAGRGGDWHSFNLNWRYQF